jgi:ATP-dependent DNA helicase DinG
LEIQSASGLQKLKLSLPPGTRARFEAFCDSRSITKSDGFFTLALAGLAQLEANTRKQAERDKKFAQSPKSALPFEAWCSEQAQFWQAVQPALLDQKIVMAEGSTGIGKGRVLAAAASLASKRGLGPVWVTTSTVVLVGSLFNEFLALPKTIIYGLCATILPGRTEFVSVKLLRQYQESFRLLEPEQAAALDKWIADGGKPVEKGPLTLAIKKMGIAPCWLVNDLKAIAPSYPVGDVVLSRAHRGDDDDDPGAVLAQELRLAAIEKADIIFATHAMLGVAQLTGWTIAPAPKFLIVDEAHLLEQTISNIRSRQLSFFSLSGELKQLAAASPGSKVIKEAIKAVDELKGVCMRFDRSRYLKNGIGRSIDLAAIGSRNTKVLSEHMTALHKLLASRTLASEPSIGRFREVLRSAVDAANDMCDGKRLSNALLLSFSPDRRFPALQSGPRDVGGVLGALWKTAESGGIAASATVHTRSETGELRADYLARILAIPPARRLAPPPVIAQHIFTTPVLHVPGRELLKKAALVPTGIKATAAEREVWTKSVARVCDRVVRQARGGTLILCTSYTQVAALAEQLVDVGIPGDRIVCNIKYKAFSLTEREFRLKYALGLRPVLIALGPAWTGISLVDDTIASEDFLLTDLIIPRMPIGLNSSVSMQGRIERAGMAPIIQEALMVLKQGLGRLVRRTGVSDRNLWVLDGRIWQLEQSGLPALSRSAQRMLKDYRKVQEIPATADW